jgi:post-segregation antitoxin (ccd killing protein)
MTLPPLSTRTLQTAIEKKRRADATLRWQQAFRPAAPSPARRDIPAARPARG